MKIAIKHAGVMVDSYGNIAGRDAGATLVRRLIRVFPNCQVIGPGPRKCEGFDLIPLEFVDGENTIVINMDVMDSMEVWQTLKAKCAEPRVMNFIWWSPTMYPHRVERASLALSAALFPTFANSEHTANELREIVDAWTSADIARDTRIEWANLGIRLEHIQERHEPQVPVVLYPAIYLSARKRPQIFLDIVEKVAARTPIRVEARLHEVHLIKEMAMNLSQHKWAWVGPLTPSRDEYWKALSKTTAFLATASEESYGLQYIEALAAGAVGIFPNRAWARALVPEGYPFFYSTMKEGEDLLYRAVTDTAACRKELDACADGDFAGWLAKRHDDDQFEKSIAQCVQDWYGR